jgi:hypothetical protein
MFVAIGFCDLLFKVKAFNSQGDELEFKNQNFDSRGYIIHNDYDFDLFFLLFSSYYNLSFFLIVCVSNSFACSSF